MLTLSIAPSRASLALSQQRGRPTSCQFRGCRPRTDPSAPEHRRDARLGPVPSLVKDEPISISDAAKPIRIPAAAIVLAKLASRDRRPHCGPTGRTDRPNGEIRRGTRHRLGRPALAYAGLIAAYWRRSGSPQKAKTLR